MSWIQAKPRRGIGVFNPRFATRRGLGKGVLLLNRDQIRFEVLYLDTESKLEKVRSELWAVQAELRDLKKKAVSG